MYPGRQPGSRTLEGLKIKAQFEKLSAAAVQEKAHYTRSAIRHWRIKSLQNLASAIVITIASTVVIRSAITSGQIKFPAVCLAATATIANLIIVTRKHPEAEVAHFQMAKRYAAFAASCRTSVTKYEESLIEDSGFQALLEKHLSDVDELKRDAEAYLGVRDFVAFDKTPT